MSPGSPRMAQHGGFLVQRTPTTITETVQEERNVSVTPRQETVTLVLRPRKKVSWNKETVDNEHMQKKSSKICCIFHKKETLEDNSDDEDDCCAKEKGKDHPSHTNVDIGESSKRPGE